MIQIRKAADRGHARYDWLDTWHTFSFDTYFDPAQMGFRSLRVINEDRVQPGQGFGKHPHRDMEIITYVLEGALEHRDSMGNGSVIHAGELQRMSAGTGVQHSEFNPSMTEPVHFYQIWLLPDTRGIKPSYEERSFKGAEKQGKLLLVAAPETSDAMQIQQDARVYLSSLSDGEQIEHTIKPGRHAWVQAVRGAIEINGSRLETSDGAAVSDETSIVLRAVGPAEIMLFDMA
jgi:redox-sensitive bicupin YhaK (pirin superfamily)